MCETHCFLSYLFAALAALFAEKLRFSAVPQDCGFAAAAAEPQCFTTDGKAELFRK